MSCPALAKGRANYVSTSIHLFFAGDDERIAIILQLRAPSAPPTTPSLGIERGWRRVTSLHRPKGYERALHFVSCSGCGGERSKTMRRRQTIVEMRITVKPSI
jgi:hypothetical protein